jgi:hypothetical protein
MAFLSHFENDIFISYAHLNDEKPPGKEKGWVTVFREKLEYELSQRFERVGDIKIWRDKEEIGGSTFFNDAIKESINKSGLFIAITSPGYLSKESYCPNELSWFYQKAQAESYGLKIGKRSRILNVLIDNIPPEKWLPEMEGTEGIPFHDASRKGQMSHILQPNHPLYEAQIIKLADELTTTLRTFKTRMGVPPAEPAKRPQGYFKVFLAHTEGALTDTRDRVSEELVSKGIEVVTDLPPPYPAAEHEQAVRDALEAARLSIHLLDDAPGNKIQGDTANTYSRKQVELGIQQGKRQLICVPKALEVAAIKNQSHMDFIRRLESDERGQATYRFIRETPPGMIAHEIVQEIEKILKEGSPGTTDGSAALLDIHEKDEDFAPELSRVFLKRKLKLLINPASDEPQENMTLFDEVRKGVSVLIIVLGHVTDLWASRRLNFALQVAVSSLKFCGIYTPPVDGSGTPRPIDLRVFQIPPVNFPVAFFYTPQMLAGLLDQYVKRN